MTTKVLGSPEVADALLRGALELAEQSQNQTDLAVIRSFQARLALDRGQVAAAASLLNPPLVVVFYLGARLLAVVLAPLLSRGRRFYPFMPVVSLATLAVLLLGWLA